ncbi:MAG: hypothetical protein ACTTKH_03955, partial [Treponema sp.]
KENLKKVANILSKTEITNTNKDFLSDNLKINTFYKRPSTIQGSSLNTLDTSNSATEYESTPITPKILEDMENNALNNTTLNCKDGDKNISINFGKENFDISEFAKAIDNNKKFKEILNFPADTIKGTAFLSGEREKKQDGNWDVTPYVRVEELLSIIENPTLKNKVKIYKTKVRGNVKDLLPYLLPGNNIEKEYGNITFPGYMETDCTGPTWVGYNGRISDTERAILKGNEFLELSKRTNEGQTYIRNAIIKGLNLEEELIVHQANWANVIFEDSNLSKMSVIGMVAAASQLEFKKTTLLYKMEQTSIGRLILNNVTLPKQKIMEYINSPDNKVGIKKLNSLVPEIKNNLEIYGYVKDSPLEDLTSEQLSKLIAKVKMPPNYKGPQDIYEKLKKYIFKGEATNKEFTNLTGSLNTLKPQYPFLLALLQGKSEQSCI